MRPLFLLVVCLYALPGLRAQELFPHADPASNIPKNVLGIRVSSEFFNEAGQWRSWQGYKFMFGLTGKLQLTETFSFSNHHGRKLPADFISTDGMLGLHTHGVKKGSPYPYSFEALNIGLKYRFFSRDGEHRHFRMAAWLEAAGGNEAHDEAEPSLMGDNAGLGAGLIATQLLERVALSGSVGGMLPASYYETATEIRIRYGKLLHYDLSIGYLLLPLRYRDYRQTNVNLYMEFMGRSYGGAVITYKDSPVNTDGAPAFSKGSYMEVRPSVQFIFHSNLRIDISSSFLLYGYSFTKTHPAYYLTLQRYFYFNK
jgi:hypothetical protein